MAWDGPKNRTDSVDKNLIKNLTQSYDKTFSDDTLSQRDVSLNFTSETGIGVGTAFSGYSDITCIGLETRENDDSAPPAKTWTVVTKWSNSPDNAVAANSTGGGPSHPETFHQQKGKKPHERDADPLSRTVDVHFKGGQAEYVSNYDAIGKPYANVVGDPYVPGLTIPFEAGTWVLGRNYAFDSFPNGLINLQQKCNSDTYVIPYAGVAYPAYFLKFQNLNVDPVFENNVQYWRATYELAVCVNHDHEGTAIGWAIEVPSTGRRGFVYEDEDDPDMTTAELLPYKDDSLRPIPEPQFQDAWGRRLSPQDGGTWYTDIHYEIFKKFKEASFAAAGV
jgi:hypothetical protein